MNRFKTELLRKAFQNYTQSGDSTSVHQVKNADDWLHYSEALRSLADDEYIILPDDYDPDDGNVMVIFQPVHYELTSKGINYSQENLNM